ncbi:MAG: 50S ribosomal protein L4, partial [Candidatus Eremiobacterota bacterium]
KVETTPVKQEARRGERAVLPVPNALVVLDAPDLKVQKSAANLPNVEVKVVNALNVLDVVKSKRLVMTQAALEKIQEVLKP